MSCRAERPAPAMCWTFTVSGCAVWLVATTLWCCVWKWTQRCSGSGCRDVLMVVSFASRSAGASSSAVPSWSAEWHRVWCGPFPPPTLWCKLVSGVTPLLLQVHYRRLCFADITHLVVLFTPRHQAFHLPAVGSCFLRSVIQEKKSWRQTHGLA